MRPSCVADPMNSLDYALSLPCTYDRSNCGSVLLIAPATAVEPREPISNTIASVGHEIIRTIDCVAIRESRHCI
jgi:hypothetical protein